LKHPKTDLDRAWVLLAEPRNAQVKMIDVGPGSGLIFDADRDFVLWWAKDLMLVIDGVSKKALPKMSRVEWSDQLAWQTKEREFVLMNSCEHGANPNDEERFCSPAKARRLRCAVRMVRMGRSRPYCTSLSFRANKLTRPEKTA
jgi:hypothetical protein